MRRSPPPARAHARRSRTRGISPVASTNTGTETATSATSTLRARDFAHRLFATDTHEAARQADPIAEIEALASAWGAGLPMMQARDR